jgi:hypothetical protein
MTMKQGSGTTGTRDNRFPVRWVVLFTGTKATEDYQPYSSTGEDPALVREVTDMCLAFHPHADIRLFPHDRDVFLFWKAGATGEWVLTRVSLAPNPDGVRTALEYCSLVLPDDELAEVRYNPFRLRDLKIHDLAREQFLKRNLDPIAFELPARASAPSSNGTGSSAGPRISEDSLSTADNVRVLEEYSATHGDSGNPITFATWWASTGKPPTPGYFDVVLRAAPPKVMTLREAADSASTLAAEAKASLPTPPASDTVAVEMARSLVTGTDAIVNSINAAASGLNTDSLEQFQGHLADASRLAVQVSGDLGAMTRRLGSGLTKIEEAHLTAIAEAYENLSRELLKVRHPNPFAARTEVNDGRKKANGTKSAVGGTSGGKFNPGLIIAPVAVAVIAFGAWKFATPGKTPPEKPTPAASAKPTHSAATPAPANTGLTLLTKAQDEVTPIAKKKAQADARAAAKADKGELSETSIQKITLASIEASYKQKLSAEDFQKAYAETKGWDYAKFKQAITALVLTVHESAAIGAGEGKDDWKKSKEDAQKAQEAKDRAAQTQKEQTSQDNEEAARLKRQREREREREKEAEAAAARREREKEANKPKPTPKPVKPAGGSVDGTGL